MTAAWQNLTDGQGAVIAAIITLIAAVAGVLLGSAIFSRRVRDLEGALKRSETVIKGHLDGVEGSLRDYEARMNEELAALTLQVNQVSGSVADLPSSSPAHEGAEEIDAQDRMRTAWGRIRDRIEAIAADPAVDGRRRAKYGRMDRRRYGDLVASLAADGQLGRDAGAFQAAVELWGRFRSGRATPALDDVVRIEELADRLG